MPIWYAPEDPTSRHQCPCCDYFTLPERGSYLICPVCYWEDYPALDPLVFDDLRLSSGLNHGEDLRGGRENFLEFGACSRAVLEHVCDADKRARFRYERRETPSDDDEP